jgi:hypothetical protein
LFFSRRANGKTNIVNSAISNGQKNSKKIVALGEIMLRLSTLIRLSIGVLDVCYGGAEARKMLLHLVNFGCSGLFVTKGPNNPLGSAINQLNRFGLMRNIL